MRQLTLIFSLVMILVLAACNQQPATNDAKTSTDTPVTENSTIEAVETNYEILPAETTELESLDGMPMYGKLYLVNSPKPPVVLCHQAGSSKDEYKDIATKLNAMGYSCFAVDQRSGGDRLGGFNETATLAKQEGKKTTYLDAEQDILAAIKFFSGIANKPVVLVGSSYSAALALKIAKENEKVSAVAAFSPGEYFQEAKGATFIQDAMKELDKPLFLTSSKEEAAQVTPFLAAATSENKTQYTPELAGIHGARALWSSTEGNEAYWTAFTTFLESL